MPAPLLKPWRPRQRRSTQAFTLPEFLVYVSAGGLLLVLATTTLLSSLRSNRSMELRQRAEERWNRVSTLIQSEVSEAESILPPGFAVFCSGVAGSKSGDAILSLRIPYLTANQAERQAVDIHYYLNGSGATAELKRCGPPYARNGALIIGTVNESTVSMRTELQVTNPSSDSATYTLNFYTPEGTLALSRSSRATVGVEPTSVCNAAQTTCNP
jgi:hypothetical protein